MITIDLDGYIDEMIWWGDEITPDMLRKHLTANPGDILFRLNSYGGSCNAATRMYDMLREHPGNITIRISGAACSAASFLALGANRVEMTPGSQIMIHDPATIAWGQEKDLTATVNMLHAAKESILNIYTRNVKTPRDELAKLMTAETWYHAEEALEAGFIHAITGDETAPTGLTNAAQPHKPIDREDARSKVRAWFERRTPGRLKPEDAAPAQPQAPHEPPTPEQQPDAGVFVGNRLKLLILEG